MNRNVISSFQFRTLVSLFFWVKSDVWKGRKLEGRREVGLEREEGV